MTLVILLFLIGALLIGAEVLVPGGILGGMGGVLLLAGCATAFLKMGTAQGLAATAIAVAITAGMLFIEFKILPKTRLGRRAFLTTEIKATSQALGPEARNLAGKEAQALTMLSPSGMVSVDGKRYEAFCRNGQVPAGTLLKVLSADNFQLTVTPVEPGSDSPNTTNQPL
jgi:membrane-bound ClpP family serine protease